MKLEVNPYVSYADLEGEVVLCNSESGLYFALNETGAAIWRLVMENQLPEQIVARLQQQYPDEADRASADVAEFLEALIKSGIIRTN